MPPDAPPNKDPEEPRDLPGSLAEKGIDKALKTAFGGWLERADDSQKMALIAFAAALAVGPLGLGFLGLIGVLYSKAAIPTAQQVEAAWWLFLITLPVAAVVGVLVLLGGRLNLPWLGAVVGVAALWGVGQMETANTQLGDLYCYGELHGLEIQYEKECRDFNEKGFVTDANRLGGHPGVRGGLIAGLALIYTADARGWWMVLTSIVAAASLGYLVRRSLWDEH
jgi:hypothetical protein